MRSLLQFLARFHVFFLFLALEIISLILIVNYNNFQRVRFLNSSNRLSASVYELSSNLTSYFQLRRINEELAAENAELQTKLQKLQVVDIFSQADTSVIRDTTYQFIPAPQYAQLNEIPFHVELAAGDTIITSGYSSIFPGGILIGVIEDFNHDSGANFYQVNVRLSTNFKTISHVELVKNNFLEEQIKLEELNTDD